MVSVSNLDDGEPSFRFTQNSFMVPKMPAAVIIRNHIQDVLDVGGKGINSRNDTFSSYSCRIHIFISVYLRETMASTSWFAKDLQATSFLASVSLYRPSFSKVSDFSASFSWSQDWNEWLAMTWRAFDFRLNLLVNGTRCDSDIEAAQHL